jgi:hypothetical protein
MVYKKGREGRDEFAFMKQHLQGPLESLEAIACLKQWVGVAENREKKPTGDGKIHRPR